MFYCKETLVANCDNLEGKNAAQMIDDGWEASRSNEVISRLRSNESLQSIMESFPEFSEIFRELDTIDCSDGRVLCGRKIGIAGSGLLLSPSERAAFVERYKGKIKTVTTHADCGAAALKFRSLKPEEIPVGVYDADEYGTWCGQQLAADLGANHEYLERGEMANDYHNEVALVLDQTGEFDSTNLENFPNHFVCTGAGLGFSEDYMKSELQTLVGIALGHHGFGERFTSNNPFYIIVSANNQEDLSRWQDVASKALADLGERIAVKGFVRKQ